MDCCEGEIEGVRVAVGVHDGVAVGEREAVGEGVGEARRGATAPMRHVPGTSLVRNEDPSNHLPPSRSEMSIWVGHWQEAGREEGERQTLRAGQGRVALTGMGATVLLGQ
jgi:hypothetical protein